jgi:hypothetical protein
MKLGNNETEEGGTSSTYDIAMLESERKAGFHVKKELLNLLSPKNVC